MIFKLLWKKIIWQVAKAVYHGGGRKILKSFVNDPKKQWDDIAMRTVDALFGEEEIIELTDVVEEPLKKWPRG